MFTGIIEDIGTVKSIEKKGAFGRIVIETALDLAGARVGDSISVDGSCLTVTGVSQGAFGADLSDETLRVTTLGSLKKGSRVNLEPALTLSRPLGGHLVTGHVDGVGTIKRKVLKGESMDLEVSCPKALMGQIVKKGSVAVDGISLTVAELMDDGFRVAVIPHTLKKTTLLAKKEGERVNIETDVIGKYVEKHFSSGRKGITGDFLSEHGFLK
ncbi:MAG: riboflavin synthase [Deltaproteobacteria bacterium]|nr:riboflavin synthase [Deltaproteobacteria bacterium]